MSGGFRWRLLQGGSLSVVKLTAGLIKIKIIATLLGVDGVGYLSLMLQFYNALIAAISMTLSTGVINLGRPHVASGRMQDAGAIVGTAIFIVCTNAVVLFVIFLASQAEIRSTIFDNGFGAIVLWPLVAAAFLAALASVWWESITFAIDRFDLYVWSNIAATVWDAVVFVVAIWLFGLQGAVFAACLSAAGLFASFACFVGRTPVGGQIVANLSWRRENVQPLLSYAALMLSTTVLGSFALLSARASIVAHAGGATANGLLQVVTALSAYLSPFIMNGVWGHLHPKAAAQGDTPEMRLELSRTLETCARLAASGCVTVVITAPILIPLAYTSKFLGAHVYLGAYFAGDIAFLLASAFAAYLLAIGAKRAYWIGYSGYHLLLLGGVLLFAGDYGAWAYVGSHVVVATLAALAAAAFAVWNKQLTSATLLRIGGWWLAGASVCAIAAFEVNAGISGIASLVLGALVAGYGGYPFARTALARLSWK